MIESRIGPADLGHLERCLDLAAEGRWRTAPNPQVGAVLVRDGAVLGEGHHRRAGAPHAEIEALEVARRSGVETRGATLYVNLEPCGHAGRTPPCVEAVIEAGVRRVVCVHRDPNPVAEGGADRLRRAGIEVDFLDPAVAEEFDLLQRAVAQNARFLVPIVRRRPFVTLKWAMTLDGRIATRTGESQWISSTEGRNWALELREVHDAILVGSGTAVGDDPRLTRRLGLAEGEFTRVVMDRRLRTPPDAALLAEPGPVLVYTGSLDSRPRASEGVDSAAVEPGSSEPREARAAALRAAGATVVELETCGPADVVADLAGRGVSSLLVEGGGQILGSFVDAELVDRVGVCCAPKLFGGSGAPGPVAGFGVASIEGAIRLARRTVEGRGPDVIVEGMEERCLRDLLSSVVGS